MKEHIKVLEKRIEKLMEQTKMGSTKEEKEGEKGEKSRIKFGKVKKKMERQEKRRKNIIIRTLEVTSRKRREAVKKVKNGIGVKVDIRKITKIERGRIDGKKMVVVKVEGGRRKQL